MHDSAHSRTKVYLLNPEYLILSTRNRWRDSESDVDKNSDGLHGRTESDDLSF